MKTHIIKFQSPFTQSTADIYVIRDRMAPAMYVYTFELHSATRFKNRNELRKVMNRVATQFMHELGYLRSTNPKAITVNE